VESYSELVFGRMEAGFTRYAQLGKFREIQKQLNAWERKVPGFLDWRKPASERLARTWLKLQRSYLESQYQCIVMKISWSTASLDPSLMAKLQSMWEGGDPYADARVAASRVLDIVKDSVATTPASTGLLHSDAVRATTLLLQTLLRNNHQEHLEKKAEIIDACREGIALCRSLVPVALAKAEKTIEKLLDEHIERAAKIPPLRDDPVHTQMFPSGTDAVGSPSQVDHADQSGPFSFPFDNTPMDHLFLGSFQDISFMQHPQHNFPELSSFGLFGEDMQSGFQG